MRSSSERSGSATAAGWPVRMLRSAPELYLIIACVVVELAHILPRLALLAGIVVILAIVPIVRRRRQQSYRAQQPDYFAASVAVAAFMMIVAILRLLSVSGSMGIFLLVVFVALASVRIGRSFGARLDAPRPVSARRSFLESLLLLAPLLFLLPLAGIDMGLFLVMVIPLGFATLLAVGVRTARWRVIPLVVAMLLVLIVGQQVVFPSVRRIAEADSHAAQAEAYANMSRLFGIRLPVLSTPMDRAAARSVATRDRELAEALLVAAGPGAARDLLIPSIEQIWGAKAYANSGWFGEGLGRAVVGGRGVAEAVSYAENTFSVFVLAEHGALGGMLVLALYALLLGAIALIVRGNTTDIPSYRASRALFVVAGLIIAFPAVYVALSNLGWVPITGQNMPFLGLNAWSDVTICAGVVGILITGALRGLEEAR
jgi:cell division protein FtsW (lipid II flippase)